MAEAEKQDDKQLVASKAADAEASPPRKSKIKLIIIAVLALAILGGGGFFGWKFFFAAKAPAPAEAPATAGHEAAAAVQPAVDKDGKPLPPPLAPAPGMVLTLEPFMVNLADTNARRFLRVIVALDVGGEDMRKEVEARMPRIRDSLLLLFSSKNSQDLTGPQGKLRLRMEILKTVNNVLGIPNKITQAFYMEFVVQ